MNAPFLGLTPQAKYLTPLRGYRTPSTRQKVFNQRCDAFGVGEVDVVAALDLRRLEVLDLFESCHHHILWKRPALQGSYRQYRALDGGKKRQRLILSQPCS